MPIYQPLNIILYKNQTNQTTFLIQMLMGRISGALMKNLIGCQKKVEPAIEVYCTKLEEKFAV